MKTSKFELLVDLVQLSLLALAIAWLSPLAAYAADEEPVQLEDISIIGNRERPKAVTIVPWQRAPGAELLGRPSDSVLDETLTPLEREVFLREIRYTAAARAAAKKQSAE